MREQDLLIQRFLDDDLTPEERVAFLQAVDADPSLRRHWLNLELVVAEAAQLPRLAPSARFLAQVQGKLALSPTSLWDRLRAAITAPRTLEWNFVSAMAAVCVAVVAVVGFMQFAPERIVEVPVTTTPAQTASLEAGQATKVYVRLVLLQPGAHSVSVAGDFNGWNPSMTTMDRSDSGVWTTTIQLKPGRYQYMFVIDGKQWIADPLAREDAGDGFGSNNAVLDVTTL
ncbi:MAG: isoamylase early set domain-containing protein [Nitrospirae bacterium]|nr:isoamylase early set domain-containing protein [Nitrospirota bacterium]